MTAGNVVQGPEVALITGARRGIGRAVALKLAGMGIEIALNEALEVLVGCVQPVRIPVAGFGEDQDPRGVGRDPQ